MDEDINNMLTNFIGQTYGEILKLDKNIVGQSQHLKPKSNEFKNLATTILANKPHVTQEGVTQPQIQTQPQITITQPIIKPTNGQLEFDFDDSATAKNIYKTLQRIEDKLNCVFDRLQKLEQI
jgi:outer membrane protein OmpA-like peptidoglycan-associated protein